MGKIRIWRYFCPVWDRRIDRIEKLNILMPVKAYIFLLITTLLWAGNAVVAKFAVGHISPLTLSLFRWILAFSAILALSIPQLARDWPQIKQKWPLMITYGVFGFAAFNAFMYSALQYTSAINVVIEQAGIPGLIFVGNYLLFRTKVTWAQFAGFLLTLAGVAVTASHGSFEALLALDVNRGDVLMLLALVSYAAYTVALHFKPRVHWKSQMAIPALGALLACIPLAGFEYARGTMIWPDQIGWAAVFYTGIFPSLISQVLFVRGVELIGPNRAGLFINAIPVFGVILSVIFLGEGFFAFHLAAMMLVSGGIAVAERAKAR